MKTIWIIAVLMSLGASAALAAGWSHYVNARYGFAIDVPAGFSEMSESDNGDGATSTSADGRTVLSAWGSHITKGSFADEIAWRIEQDKGDDWRIAYDRRLPNAASWSGSQGDQIFYQRSVAGCDGAAVYFKIEYDRGALKASDAIIKRLVKSFKSEC